MGREGRNKIGKYTETRDSHVVTGSYVCGQSVCSICSATGMTC